MKDLKFKVESPEHSKAIQERLFELGFQWPNCINKIQHTYDHLAIFKGEIQWNGINQINQADRISTLNDLYNPTFLRDNLGIGKEEEKKLPKLNGRQVVLTQDGIICGCTPATHSELKSIYKASKANQKRLKPKKVDGVYEVGDIVTVKTLDFLGGRESSNWAMKEEFNLGESFIVSILGSHENGMIKPRGTAYFHHKDRFRHATKSEIKKFKKQQNEK